MGYQMREDRQRKMDWLQRFRQADGEIVSCKEELQYWKDKSGLLANCCHDLKVQGGKSLDMGDLVARIVDIETQLQYKIMRLVFLQQEIQCVIDAVPDERFRHLLQLRYLQGVTMERIAERMNYSWRQIQRLHNQALDALEGDFTTN